MNGKRFSENKARKNGFYLALAVCLVAVGIAAWSTYDAVKTYNRAVSSTSSVASRTEPSSTPRPVSTPKAASVQPTATPKAAETPKAASATVSTATPAPTEEPEAQVPVNAPLYERSSQMIFPFEEEEILKAYSAGAPVYSDTMRDWRVHTGTDFQTEANAEVRACANGQVKQTYSDSMMGNIILIEHGDYEFSYCGVGEDFQVKEGDIVTKGQVIGRVTAVPSEAAEEPHLHLEVRRDGVYLDPESVIKGQE